MQCQTDADCGAGFCNAATCGPRAIWNLPTKLTGAVALDGTNQSGSAVRGDNLELVCVTNRNTSCADLWHAQRTSSAVDFLTSPCCVLTNMCSAWERCTLIPSSGALFDEV